MLLSIDNNKIEEELRNSPQRYVVSATYVEPEVIGNVEIPSSEAYSATNVLPLDAQAARDRMLALRRDFIERGGEVLSGDALARVIDDTRGR